MVTHEMAQGIFARLTPVARSRGWLLTWYGSSARELMGNDLDLILVPFAPHCAPPDLIVGALASELGASFSGPSEGAFALCYTLHVGAVMLDIQVREQEMRAPPARPFVDWKPASIFGSE